MAQTLIDGGRTDVTALLGGYAAWQQAGLPTETAAGTPAP